MKYLLTAAAMIAGVLAAGAAEPNAGDGTIMFKEGEVREPTCRDLLMGPPLTIGREIDCRTGEATEFGVWDGALVGKSQIIVAPSPVRSPDLNLTVYAGNFPASSVMLAVGESVLIDWKLVDQCVADQSSCTSMSLFIARALVSVRDRTWKPVIEKPARGRCIEVDALAADAGNPSKAICR